MIERKHILSIGTDLSVSDTCSQFHKRFAVYDTYHSHTLIVLGVGESQEITVGESRVLLVGGKTKVSSFLKALQVALREVKTQKFDLVTTQDVLYAGLVGFFASRRADISLFVQLHGDYLDNERWFKSNVGTFNRLMNIIGKYILKRADYIRVVSLRLKKQIVNQYSLDTSKIISIPIGTDTSMFLPSKNQERDPVIVFAQRLILEKQPMLFVAVTIEVMNRLPEVKVAIAGDGPMKEDMQKAYKSAGLLNRVTFLGTVTQTDLVSLYQNAQCYLHTADWEGWGMPMIEAMATGCPVVTTDTGCAGEAVKHDETGLVVPINDTEALVSSVASLLNDDALWQRLSRQGIIEAQEWSFETLTRKNMEWYANSN